MEAKSKISLEDQLEAMNIVEFYKEKHKNYVLCHAKTPLPYLKKTCYWKTII